MAKPQLYTKRPVTIEAMRWAGTVPSATPILDWIDSYDVQCGYVCTTQGCSGTDAGHAIEIRTLEGKMQASPGDFIIKGVQGEFYPCKPDIFHLTYDTPAEVTNNG